MLFNIFTIFINLIISEYTNIYFSFHWHFYIFRRNDKKRERQQRYREKNREKLKHREAERRKRKQNLQINLNRIEINNEETTDANSQSFSGLEGTQTSFVQENEQYIFHLTSYRHRELRTILEADSRTQINITQTVVWSAHPPKVKFLLAKSTRF